MAQKPEDRTKEPCEKCGEQHAFPSGVPRCIGHNRTTGAACKRAPKIGMTVCDKHGGASPVIQKWAAQKQEMEQVHGEIAQLLDAVDMPNQHPIEGLLEVVRHSGQMYRVLTELVGDLKEDPTVDHVIVGMNDEGEPVTKAVYGSDGLWGVDHNGDQVAHVYLSLLEKWTTIYSRSCKLALDAGIDERRVQLAEQTTDTMFNAVTRAMQIISLSPDLRDAFNKALAAELRTVGVDRALEM